VIEKKTTRPAKRKAKVQAGVDAMHHRYSGVFERLAGGLDEIASQSASLPVLDPRPADETLAYDEDGLLGKS